MKRVALLLAGLALGMTSPAMADAWAPGGFMPVAIKDLQLAQNDDSRRDRRPPARPEREERGEPKGQREAPARREAPPQREPGPQREAPQREAPQREAPPQRDPRYMPDRREPRQPEARQAPERDPREAYDRRGGGRPEAPVAPQAYAAPRLSEQSAIGAVRQRYPGGRLMDSAPVMRNGRTYYSVRLQTRGGELVDVLVDGMTGDISRGGG
jgi:hypothetical protein